MNRLPVGSGRSDAEHPVAAYLRISEAMEAAASTYLAADRTRVAVAKPLPPDHAGSEAKVHGPIAGGEGHGRTGHGSAATAHPRYTVITPETASEIASALLDPRVVAFLRLISFEEHGRERDENYRTRFGDPKGRDPINDNQMKHYVAKDMSDSEERHTPAGAYQITSDTYVEAVERHIVADFLPSSQDRIAVWLLQRRHALQDIENQDLDKAFNILKKTWSSLPGGDGMKETLESAKSRYKEYLAQEIKKRSGMEP